MAKLHSTLKNSIRERELFKKRMLAVCLGIGILLFILVARLTYLQIYQHKFYTTLARQNQLGLVDLAPARGLIYDRNGVLLAENIPIFNLVITPDNVKNISATIEKLQHIIKISPNDLKQFHRQLAMHRRFESVILRMKLTEEEIAHFSIHGYDFPGVSIQSELVRFYPLGQAFTPVVGYVGRINPKEFKNIDPINYSATQFIGKTGVEQYYEGALHGTVGYKQVETDVRGQVIRLLKQTAPISGENLYLTIDSKLQMAAYKSLGDQRGAIVIMDPRNGQILAFVSKPSFDPNLFVDGISEENYQAIQKGEGEPLYNRALRGVYHPGSTIKPYISIAGLQSGLLDPSAIVNDTGSFQINGKGRIFHNFQHHIYGPINLLEAITISSDFYFYTLGLKLGIRRIDNTLEDFGFGKPTGIDLPNEAIGIVPSPTWKHTFQKEQWYQGDTLNTSVGQGYMLATPLQMASAVSRIALNGQQWQPHVLLSSQTSQGNRIDFKNNLISDNALPKNISTLIREAMENVINSPSGSGYRFYRKINYTVAGKTGTAQNFSAKKGEIYNSKTIALKLRDNSLFIAFAPVDNPKIALAVVVQNSFTPAVAIARQLLDYYFNPNLYSVTPSPRPDST